MCGREFIPRPREADDSDTSNRGISAHAPPFCQRRCYDHNCTTIDSVREKVHYCWYHRRRDVPLRIDEDVF